MKEHLFRKEEMGNIKRGDENIYCTWFSGSSGNGFHCQRLVLESNASPALICVGCVLYILNTFM